MTYLIILLILKGAMTLTLWFDMKIDITLHMIFVCKEGWSC
jgi:hypothetical protein